MGAEMTVSRPAIVAEAKTWLGTPFVHQGRQKGVGVDCIGLTIGVAMALGIVDATQNRQFPTDYRRQPDPKRMRALLEAHMVSCWPPQIGDWLWLAPESGQQALHMVMVASEQSIIHAYEFDGFVVEHPVLDTGLRLTKGAYSYKAVIDG
jgi:cell wall-associated NlpC family hydrolase